MIDFDEYQKKAHQTAIYGDSFSYPFLGLAGEAGELCNQAKKIVLDDGATLTDQRKERMADEIGDVLWYVAEICTTLGISMQDAAKNNLEKLGLRAARGTLHGDRREEKHVS